MSEDVVRHPRHYAGGGWPFECIDLTRCLSFCLGNAVKYVWRHRDKGTPRQDLEKALVYLEWSAEDLALYVDRERALSLVGRFQTAVLIKWRDGDLTRDEADTYLLIPAMVYGGAPEMTRENLQRAIARTPV